MTPEPEPHDDTLGRALRDADAAPTPASLSGPALRHAARRRTQRRGTAVAAAAAVLCAVLIAHATQPDRPTPTAPAPTVANHDARTPHHDTPVSNADTLTAELDAIQARLAALDARLDVRLDAGSPNPPPAAPTLPLHAQRVESATLLFELIELDAPTSAPHRLAARYAQLVRLYPETDAAQSARARLAALAPTPSTANPQPHPFPQDPPHA